MSDGSDVIVLGSRSPRRLELLALLIERARIEVVPPSDPREAGFEGLVTCSQIEQRLTRIARDKNDAVAAHLRQPRRAILTADTIIVAQAPDGRRVVLGQPPDDASWPDVVRGWFRTYYLGKTHAALTAVCLRTPDGLLHESLVETEVDFVRDGESLLDWYIATGEPRGKAGGYALQGAADVFVERIVGSPSNVVGLPLRETRRLLAAWLGPVAPAP